MKSRFIYPVLTFIIILLLWELGIDWFNVPAYLLPRPIEIFRYIFENLNMLLINTKATALEACLGFFISIGISMFLVTIFNFFESVKHGVYPIFIALQTTPIIALSPLIIVWFGTGLLSKIVVVTLICFFPMIVNTMKGIEEVNQDYFDLFNLYSASKWTVFRRLKLPFSLPYFFSALKISSTLAVVGAVIGEFVGSRLGLGYLILTASYRLRTVMMFAAISMAALTGFVFYFSIVLLEKLLINKKKFN